MTLPTQTRMRRRAFAVWGAWLGMLTCITTFAQHRAASLDPTDPHGIPTLRTHSLTIEHRIGFRHRLFTNHANLAMFRLQHSENAVLKGTLELIQITMVPGRGPVHYTLVSRTLELAPNSSRRVITQFPPVHGQPVLVLRWRDEAGATLWQAPYQTPERATSRHALRRLWVLLERELLPELEGDHDRLPPWALPSDPLQLAFVDGILIDRATLDRLLPRQEWALAHYVARGGTLMIPNDAVTFERRCLGHQPFPLPPHTPEIRRVPIGLGQLLRFPQAALTGTAEDPLSWMSQAITTPSSFTPIASPHLSPSRTAASASPYFRAQGPRSGQSKRTCLLAAAVFTLITGPGAWLFRRASRRRFLLFMGSTLTLSCLIAAMIGFYLSRSPGELWWSSVTEISPGGGALQTAVLKLESAGARDHRLRFESPASEVFFRKPQNTILAGEETPAPFENELRLSLLPWSRTYRTSEAYALNLQPIVCQLTMEEWRSARLSWENPNPFRITGVELLVQQIPAMATTPARRSPRSRPMIFTVAPSRVLSGTADLEDASTSAELTMQPKSPFQLPLLDAGSMASSSGSVPMRVTSRLPSPQPQSSLAAWVLFRIDRSPGLQMDTAASDFVGAAGSHYVLQRLPDDQLPPMETVALPANRIGDLPLTLPAPEAESSP